MIIGHRRTDIARRSCLLSIARTTTVGKLSVRTVTILPCEFSSVRSSQASSPSATPPRRRARRLDTSRPALKISRRLLTVHNRPVSPAYGVVQQSDLSATHEEYREARESRPVLVFIQQATQPEPRQLDFIREVQGWERGHFTARFADADDLRSRVMRALHDFRLANEAAPLNEAELLDRARALLPTLHNTNQAAVFVAVAPGPTRAVLRPAQLEDERLRRSYSRKH